jgi:hypothetical protein
MGMINEILGDPDNRVLRAISGVFVLASFWGLAWLVGWVFGSRSAFWILGLFFSGIMMNNTILWYKRERNREHIKRRL